MSQDRQNDPAAILHPFTKTVLLLWLPAIAIAIVYELYGKSLIIEWYQRSVEGETVVPFIDASRKTLEYYLYRGRLIVWEYIFFAIPCTLIFWHYITRGAVWVIKYGENEAILPQQQRRVTAGALAAAFGIYTLLTVVFFSPCLGTISTHLIGPPEDNMAGLWALWWASDMCALGPESLAYTNYLYWPEGTSLYYFAWSFYNLGVTVLLRPFLDLTTIFNLVQLHGYPIAGVGAFLLAHRITGRFVPSLIAGFIFAFSPNHFARSQHHIHMNSIQFIPFFVYFYLSAVQSRARRHVILASVFFLLNALCDWTYMIMGGYFIGFHYLYSCVRSRHWLDKELIRVALSATVPTLIVCLPWLIPMLRIGLVNPEVGFGGTNSYVVDLLGLVTPGKAHILGDQPLSSAITDTFTGNAWEAATYLGIINLLIIVLAGRQILMRSSFYAFAAGAFLLIAFGNQLHLLGTWLPIALPYTIISQIPFLGNLRAPARFIVYTYLFWGVLVALSWNVLFSRNIAGTLKRVVAIVLSVLIFVDFFSLCSDRTAVSAPSCYAELRQQERQSGILQLPDAYVNTTRYMMEQTIHQIPMLQGAATRKVGRSLIDELNLSNLDALKEQLRDTEVEYIIVRKDLPECGEVPIWQFRSVFDVFYEDRECLIIRLR